MRNFSTMSFLFRVRLTFEVIQGFKFFGIVENFQRCFRYPTDCANSWVLQQLNTQLWVKNFEFNRRFQNLDKEGVKTEQKFKSMNGIFYFIKFCFSKFSRSCEPKLHVKLTSKYLEQEESFSLQLLFRIVSLNSGLCVQIRYSYSLVGLSISVKNNKNRTECVKIITKLWIVICAIS